MTDEPDPPEPPGMTGPLPSARGPSASPNDPARHADLICREWEDVAEVYTQGRMRELGIPEEMIGVPRRERGYRRAAFIADERDGGGVTTDGINLDSGALNPDLMSDVSLQAHEAHRKARFRARIDACIAHEYEEARHKSHAEAVAAAPDTELPIGEGARRLLRAIAGGEKGRGR